MSTCRVKIRRLTQAEIERHCHKDSDEEERLDEGQPNNIPQKKPNPSPSTPRKSPRRPRSRLSSGKKRKECLVDGSGVKERARRSIFDLDTTNDDSCPITVSRKTPPGTPPKSFKSPNPVASFSAPKSKQPQPQVKLNQNLRVVIKHTKQEEDLIRMLVKSLHKEGARDEEERPRKKAKAKG